MMLSAGCSKDESKVGAQNGEAAEKAQPVAPDINPRLLRRFKPARAVIGSDDDEPTEVKVALGQLLFHDERLGADGKRSCSSCHQLTRYGVDGRKQPRLSTATRNVPTVYHAAGHFEFSDGRAKTIEDQARFALLNEAESGATSEETVVSLLKAMPDYVASFKLAFPGEEDPVTFENVGVAIGAFERHLTTRSKWDEFLEGDPTAINVKEAEGLKLFLNLGCTVCHMGEQLGGTMYEKLGAVVPWPNQDDLGRFRTTKNEADRMMFKVPTLRNVSETAPYFHDGYTDDLKTAVSMMAKHQTGMALKDDEVDAIVTWLKSLKGELPKQYLGAPELPELPAPPVVAEAQEAEPRDGAANAAVPQGSVGPAVSTASDP